MWKRFLALFLNWDMNIKLFGKPKLERLKLKQSIDLKPRCPLLG